MTPDQLCYLAQVVAAVIYAGFLEFIVTRRRYENGWTWATVVGGVLMVGLIVRARISWAPPPQLFQAELVDWSWWLWVYSFCWAAGPIVGWQILVHYRHIMKVIAYLRGR